MTARSIAPGRVNLIGEHVDYLGGPALPFAIAQAVTVTARPQSTFSLASADFPEKFQCAAIPEPPYTGWTRYPLGVLRELQALGRSVAPMALHVESAIPFGSGLSSSAALCIAVARVFAADLDDRGLVGLCQRVEHRYAGTPCGAMDFWASLASKAGHGLYLHFGRAAQEHVPLKALDGSQLLLAHSRVRRELSASGYGQRLAECREIAVQLHKQGLLPDGEITSLWRATDETLEGATGLSEALTRRLRHIVSECRRVEEVVSALRGNHNATVFQSINACHASLRDDYEVSCPELDRMAEIALDAGASACRMMGGGFGGCVLAITEDAEGLREALAEGYYGPEGKTPLCIEVASADGATFLSV